MDHKQALPRYSATSFVEEFDDAYRRIWNALGWPWDDAMIAAARATAIISGNQRQFRDGFVVSDEQWHTIVPQLVRMGWYDGIALEPGFYSTLLMQGMSFKGMITMVRNLLEAIDSANGVLRFGTIYAVAGQRLRSDTTDGTLRQVFKALLPLIDHPWIVERMEVTGDFTEWEMFVMAIMLAARGTCTVGNYRPALVAASQPDGLPPRTDESVDIMLPDHGLTIRVINAPAEQRAVGAPRATSKGNVRHVMNGYGIPDGSTLAIMASRVGARRVMATSENMLHSINPTVNVVGFAAPLDDVHLHRTGMLIETAQMLMKAIEECLNGMLPDGAARLNSRDVRLLLDRIVDDAFSIATVAAIYREVGSGTVARA